MLIPTRDPRQGPETIPPHPIHPTSPPILSQQLFVLRRHLPQRFQTSFFGFSSRCSCSLGVGEHEGGAEPTDGVPGLELPACSTPWSSAASSADAMPLPLPPVSAGDEATISCGPRLVAVVPELPLKCSDHLLQFDVLLGMLIARHAQLAACLPHIPLSSESDADEGIEELDARAEEVPHLQHTVAFLEAAKHARLERHLLLALEDAHADEGCVGLGSDAVHSLAECWVNPVALGGGQRNRMNLVVLLQWHNLADADEATQRMKRQLERWRA
eukprot:7391676-Prymnesium_polylepis.1